MASFCLVGSTGLVGSYILTTLSTRPEIKNIYAFSRRDLPANEKIKTIISSEISKWPTQFPQDAEVLISGLGTTRATAGGFDNQYKIDHDANLDLAKAAKAAGTKSYVLISSQGANSSSMLGYPKMKGQLEEEVQALGFDHVVLVRPGLIVGERASHDSRAMEYVARRTAMFAGSVSNKLKDSWAQDAEVIARAAVRASIDCIEGKQKEKLRILAGADIVRLGREEWTD